MKIRSFLFSMLALCFIGCTPEEEIIDDVFRAYLETNFDTDGDGLDEAEILAVDTIICDRMGIYTLDGIDEFVNLRYLSCEGNEMLELDLSGNPDLRYLNCSANELTGLDVSENPELEFLYCSENHLTSLDLSNNLALGVFDCHAQSLKVTVDANRKFDLSQLPGFDVSRAYDWVGGTVDGTVLTFNRHKLYVVYIEGRPCVGAKYSYRTGLPGYGVAFTLYYDPRDLE